jgi:hypothetical protein
MAQDILSAPPTRGTVDEVDASGRPSRVSRPWSAWFDGVFLAVFALYQSGTTAQRPTTRLWIGRPYFDTTVGHIIHYDGTQWVDATGAAV